MHAIKLSKIHKYLRYVNLLIFCLPSFIYFFSCSNACYKIIKNSQIFEICQLTDILFEILSCLYLFDLSAFSFFKCVLSKRMFEFIPEAKFHMLFNKTIFKFNITIVIQTLVPWRNAKLSFVLLISNYVDILILALFFYLFQYFVNCFEIQFQSLMRN